MTHGHDTVSVLLKTLLFLATFFLLCASAASGRMYEEPKSFGLKDESQQRVDVKVVPGIDAKRLLAEEEKAGKNARTPGPVRFAVPAEVAFTPDNSGTWQDMPDGRLWRLRIQSSGSLSINLGITRFDLPEGAKLWIYGPDHKHVEGPYTSKNRSHAGSLWTPMIEGEEIVVELFVPAGARKPVLEIQKVNRGFRGFTKTGLFGGSEGTCETDVICPEGNNWRDQIRAINAYTINGTGACTGNLMNNTALDFKPYVLSANHCGVNTTTDSTIVVFWNFESATCGTHGPGSTTDTQSGATFRASNAASDFVLFELDAAPDAGFHVFFAGWDRSGTAPPGVECIHHPSADVKAISRSDSSPQDAAWTGTGDGGTLSPGGNHWRVDWTLSVTEPGSSGSCIFTSDTKRCIGQLHGGPSACGLASASLHDYFGKFSVSWTGGGTNSTRLSNWLDPGNTGVMGLDGDPHITTIDGVHYDFQGAGEFVSLRNPDGLEIQTRQAPIATTFFPGPDDHDGLATCVALNTAVAVKIGKKRVSYEPNLSGVPDPSGLQLRVEGTVTTVPAGGLDTGDGGHIFSTSNPGELEFHFPDHAVLLVTPSWWSNQSKWFLNVDMITPPHTTGMNGGEPGGSSTASGGITGPIPRGSWLPALPDGSSVGPMPAALHDRYVTLYQKFADAWRVTDKTSLFDYSEGTSTGTFTMKNWPLDSPPCTVPDQTAARPATLAVAQEACRAVKGKFAHRDCVFDVRVTGNKGFARTYVETERARNGGTATTVRDDRDPTKPGEPVTFTATVSRTSREGQVALKGTVQFVLNGEKVGSPVAIDAKGQAHWKTAKLSPGEYKVVAHFMPAGGSGLRASESDVEVHTVLGNY